MDNRKEILFSDLGALCEPKLDISPVRERCKWNAVSYRTEKVTGTMLTSMLDGRPNDVSFDPQLVGWYKIFIGHYCGSDMFNLKLSSDPAFSYIVPGMPAGYARHAIEDVYWKAADMTGERMIIGKHRYNQPHNAAVAWFRFVPMTDEEVAELQTDRARKDTKRIYATNDMHGQLFIGAPRNFDEWRIVAQSYAHTDVEWFSMENILIFDGDTSTGSYENFAYPRFCDEIIQYGLKKSFTKEMLADMCAFTRSIGIKPCLSMRMGAWGMEYPYDQMYFVNTFMEENKEKYRCIDRDGTPIDALSYVYPEVRRYVIDQFVSMAKLGAEAVEMIYSRGVPYVLFEQPFVERFMAEYGEDPRPLALDDERVTELRCRYMTEFVRELRAALNEVSPEKKVGLHARCQYCLYDARHVALDVAQWVKEGLITAIISYPQRVREVLKGDIWADEDRIHLDMAKYTQYMEQAEESIIYRRQDFNTLPPMEDSRGVLQGPKDQQERVAEFMALEKTYGVPVYFEIMPRFMPVEEYKARALELYQCGAEHISLWDTYNRVPNLQQWSMLRRLGHKEELSGFTSGEGELFCLHRLLHIADKDVSRYIPAWGG